MLTTSPRSPRYDSGPNMTPLVDVVMVILIFLMLAGSFATGGWYLQSSMPIKESGGAGAPPHAAVERAVPRVRTRGRRRRTPH